MERGGELDDVRGLGGDEWYFEIDQGVCGHISSCWLCALESIDAWGLKVAGVVLEVAVVVVSVG